MTSGSATLSPYEGNTLALGLQEVGVAHQDPPGGWSRRATMQMSGGMNDKQARINQPSCDEGASRREKMACRRDKREVAISGLRKNEDDLEN